MKEKDDDIEEAFAQGEKMRWDFKSLKSDGVSWRTRILLRMWPMRGIMRLSRELGRDPEAADKLHAVFSKTKTVDLLPSRSGGRGFQIIMDRSTALYFYQDGDHFVYDGWETGDYEKGDVTVFDAYSR